MGRRDDQDHKMKGVDDHNTTSPPEPMELFEESNVNWQSASSRSWTKRFSNRFREQPSSAPVHHGRVTRKTASHAQHTSVSNASEAKPRRRSHDNPRDYSEPCEDCIKLSEFDEKLQGERNRLSESYEMLLRDKEAEFQAVVAENDVLRKEIDRLQSILESVGGDEKTQQQLEILTKECNQRNERIRTLESELDSMQTLIADQKPENTSCYIVHIDDLKEKLEKSHKEAEDLKEKLEKFHKDAEDLRFDRDTYNGKVQSMVGEHKAMRQAIDSLKSELATRDNDVRGLKQEISRFRAGNPAFVPDNQIIADYQYFLSQLTNWTLSNFRKLEPTNLDHVISKLGLEPSTYDAITGCMTETAGRKCLAINMLVMKYLVRGVFRPFLFGLDATEEVYLKSLESSFFEQSTEKEVQLWRSTTLRMVIASKSHKGKVDSSIDKVVSELGDFLESIFPPSDSSPISNHRMEVLRMIVTHAVDLALTLRVQRPLYKLSVRSSGSPFHKNFMESAEPSLDDDDNSGDSILGSLRSMRTNDKVRLTIFPLLIKAGNEDGDGYDTHVVIHKGKILKA